MNHSYIIGHLLAVIGAVAFYGFMLPIFLSATDTLVVLLGIVIAIAYAYVLFVLGYRMWKHFKKK